MPAGISRLVKVPMRISPQVKMVVAYLSVGLIWILGSDHLIGWLWPQADAMARAQSVKGAVFIAVTAVMLYSMLRCYVTRMEALHRQVVDSYDQTIRGWVTVMDARHRETRHHSERVTAMALALAQKMGVTDPAELKQIERGAILHDIGKMGIPDAVLTKPGRLTDDEMAIMRRHPVIAREILEGVRFLDDCHDIPYYHHERWDGTGYPEGLSGTEIPFHARLFGLVDVWDAISSARVYKDPWPEEQVLAFVEEQSGKHFDPDVARVFIQHYPELLRAVEGLDGQPAPQSLVG